MISSRDLYFMNLLSLRMEIKKTRSGVWNCKCAFGCDNKNRKKRMFFLLRDSYITVYCHDCGYSRKLKGFLEDKFPELIEEYNFYGFKPPLKKENIAEKLLNILDESQNKNSQTYIHDSELFKITKSFNDLKDSHPAKKYTKKRLIPFDQVRYCANLKKLHERLFNEESKFLPVPCLVIPFFRKSGNIEILQARMFDPKLKPKYLTLKLNPEAEKIYNQDFVEYSEDVFILEGPIDSMFVPNAIAMAGSDASPSIPGKYIWVFDNEPGNKEIVHKMNKKIDAGERIVIWRKEDNFKDINDGLVKKMFDTAEIFDILKMRTQHGIKAKLEIAKWRK